MQLATIIWPLVFAIVGALVYAFSNTKAAELGKLTFFAGMLGLVYVLMHAQMHI